MNYFLPILFVAGVCLVVIGALGLLKKSKSNNAVKKRFSISHIMDINAVEIGLLFVTGSVIIFFLTTFD